MSLVSFFNEHPLLTRLIYIVNRVSFFFLAFMLVWQVYNLIFNRGVPNIRTAPAIRKKMIELLRQDAEGKKNYTIVDLGSGNGLLTRDIARAMPQARVIGLEISPQQVMWAQAMARRAGLANLAYERGDMFERGLSESDAVVMYLVNPLMDRVGKKLHKDLKKGTLVLSNRLRLGDGWVPQVIEVKTIYPHQKNLNVYRA